MTSGTRLLARIPLSEAIPPELKGYATLTDLCILDRMTHDPVSLLPILKEYMDDIMIENYKDLKEVGGEYYFKCACETGDPFLVTLVFVMVVVHDPVFYQAIQEYVAPIARDIFRPFFYFMFYRLSLSSFTHETIGTIAPQWIKLLTYPIRTRNYRLMVHFISQSESAQYTIARLQSCGLLRDLFEDTPNTILTAYTKAQLCTDFALSSETAVPDPYPTEIAGLIGLVSEVTYCHLQHQVIIRTPVTKPTGEPKRPRAQKRKKIK